MAALDSEFELAKIRFRKLYKKGKELNLNNEDMQKFDFMKKYKEEKLNLISLFLKCILIAILVIILFILAVFAAIKLNFLRPKTVAEWTTIVTGIDLETDQCLYPFSEVLLDIFRPPVDCSFCKDVKGFDRITNLSQETFVSKYAYSGRPVIIMDATVNWTAMSKFSFNFIKSIYKKDSPVFNNDGGDSRECQFFPYKTKFDGLLDVFRMSKKMKEMKGAPWYIGWSNCDPKAANILRQYYGRPYFLAPEMESSRTDWIFMGTPGYGAHIHIDNVQHSSWQAQIQGDKEWILEPPPECYYKCEGRFKDTVRAGEIVVLDTNKWFHGTNVVGNKLSIVIGSEYD